MSRIEAEYINEEIIIKKDRARKTDKDIQIINLLNLKYNKEYKSKIKISNNMQKNEILLLTTVPDEKVEEIKIKKKILRENDVNNIDDVDSINNTDNINDVDNIDNNTEIKENDIEERELNKSGIIVYIKKKKIYYRYGKLKEIYKKMIKVKYKIINMKINKKGFSTTMYVYIINKHGLDIDKKILSLRDCTSKEINIRETTKKLSKFKLLFSKNRFKINIDKDKLLNDEGIAINNPIKIVLSVNGVNIEYKLSYRRKRKGEKSRHFYAPIKSAYIEDFAFHIRRNLKGKLVLVKRLKELDENKIMFKLMESKFVSFILYKTGNICRKCRTKNVNLYYEKYSEKAEEGTYDLFCMSKQSKRSKNFFIINKESSDYEKIKRNSNVVKKYSFKYYWLLYSSNNFISTEAPLHINILRSNNKYLRKAIYNKRFVFLQHGVTYLKPHEKNSAYVKGREATPHYIIAGSEKEKDVITDMLKIKEERILVTGLPIFSKINYNHINDDTEDLITIMLTWKPYEEHLYSFEESTYYQTIVKIFNILNNYIESKKIIIIPHPKVLELMSSTSLKERIWTGKISEILERTKLLITDYSSVCYNSFYQGAGVIFYQEDIDLYERENGKLIPTDDEYIGKRAFDMIQLENIIKETIISEKIDLSKIRNEKFEENYATINEFSDGKNIERIYEELVRLGLV